MSYIPFLEARKQRASNGHVPSQNLKVFHFLEVAPIVDHHRSQTASAVTLIGDVEREFSTQLWCIECGAFPDPEFGDATYKNGASFFCLKCLKKA